MSGTWLDLEWRRDTAEECALISARRGDWPNVALWLTEAMRLREVQRYLEAQTIEEWADGC